MSEAGGLAVVDWGSLQLMAEEPDFAVLFPPSDEGFAKWLSHCVGPASLGVTSRDQFVLAGWKPSRAYQKARNSWAAFRTLEVVAGDLEGAFDVAVIVDTYSLRLKYTGQ